MNDRRENRDRLVETLLCEVVGGERPPDLSAQILRRAGSVRWRTRGWVPIAAAAALFAGIGVLILAHDPRPRETSPTPAAPRPPERREVLDAPLPGGVQKFQGRLVGRVVSVGSGDIVIRVERVVPSRGSRASNPGLLRGREVRARLPRKPGEREARLMKAAEYQREGARVTATVWTERDEMMFLTDLRPGDQTEPDPK